MEIKEPKFKVGDKVIDILNNEQLIVSEIIYYRFYDDNYLYVLNFNDGERFGYEDELHLTPYVEKPKTVWDLKEGDTYYVISGYGEVLETTWKYNIDSNSRKIGNAFLTKEEAEFEVERRKVETEMLRLGGRRKFNRGKDNYFIMYTRIEGLDYVNYQSMHEQGVIYFDSELDAINAVKTIGKDKIKKYIFVE